MSTPWPAEERLYSLDWASLAVVRADVVKALVPVLSGAEATRALTRLLRLHPHWTGLERAVAAEGLLGVALWRRRLQSHCQEVSPDALLDVLAGELGTGCRSLRVFPVDWPTRLSYPDWLAAELTRAL